MTKLTVVGYQLLADAEGMPSAYQHLRVRLRIEQTRLLNWGQKIGLVEELLDEPSRVLQLNRNLIIDLLLEIQALFKSCIAIQAKFDHLVPEKSTRKDKVDHSEGSFDRRFPKATNALLSKTLNFLDRVPEAPRRLQWAAVKKDRFETVVKKLIDYNTSIEALLDNAAIDQLQSMQQHMYMAMLQLNSNVAELKEISKALQISTVVNEGIASRPSISGPPTTQHRDVDRTNFSRLADFKAQQMRLETQSSFPGLDPIPTSEVSLRHSEEVRSEATYQDKQVWVEWKYYLADHNPQSQWSRTIENRVKKLATLLGSADKPAQFNAPHCLGYFNDQEEGRYGFLYSKPSHIPQATTPSSLLDIIKSTTSPPSLTKRITIAHTIARCLMYLHSVNWLHKAFRSDNIIFFTPEGQSPDYTHPYIAGFEFARPDVPDEDTEPLPQHFEHDIYRHPAVVARATSRSQKSHDVYSLGIVLVEIAYWKPADEIMQIPTEAKMARSKVRNVRKLLLHGGYFEFIEGAVGEVFADAARRCIAGGTALGVDAYDDQDYEEIELNIQETFAEKVVDSIGSIRV